MKIKLLIFSFLFSVLGWGQIVIPNTTPVTENFNSMAASATASLPGNWKMSPAGAAAPTWGAGGNFTAVTQQASSGLPTAGGRYNWGTAAATDRALGAMTSGGYASPNSIMAYYRNTNAANLTQLTISYNLERYRVNSTAASVQFFYSLDGTTWTAVTGGDVAAASLPTGANTYNFTPGLTVNVGAFSITGLNIATNNDIYLRWNLNTGASNSQGIGIDDVSVTASFTAGCTGPVTQASAIGTSNSTLNGFDVNWTAGSGNGTMIVIRDNSLANALPASGTAYAANLDWASAGQIDTNNRVIFRGAGTGASPVTGLNPGTEYRVTAYEYNTTGDCYNLSSPASTVAYTMSTEPTAHAASFTCTTVSYSQIDLSFSAANTLTNGKAYLILSKIGSAPTGLPTDGVFYTAGATIGDATVVGYTSLAGTDTSFSATGLTPNSNYYFVLIPLNSYLSVPQTMNYRVSATIPLSNCTTPVGPCLADSFTAVTLPATGWLAINVVRSTTAGDYVTAPAGAIFNANSGSLTTSVISNPAELRFYLGRSSNATAKTLTVEVSTTSQLAGFITVATYDHSNVLASSYSQYIVDLSAYTNNSNVWIRFTKTSATTSPWRFDDMEVYCGTPVFPEINITGNGNSITDNDTTPAVTDNTNLGATMPGSNIVKTFTIHNSGTQNLVLSLPVTLSDVSAPQEFSITQPAISTVPVGGSTTFSVTFNSAVIGTFTNTVTINNNDSDEAVYNFDISGTATNGTVLKSGELLFVSYDGQVNGAGAEDEYLIATMVDIAPGTEFAIVNSRYEAGAAAGVKTDKWGGGGDDPKEEPFRAAIVYNGITTIPAGSILEFTTDASASWFGQVNVVSGITTTNRTNEFSGTAYPNAVISPNISSTDSDQMYLIQGNFVSDGSIDANQANYYLNGTVLHGLTNRAAWVPLANACNGAVTAGGNTRESRLPSVLTCFNVENAGATNVSGYYQNDKEHGLATLRTIITAVSNVTANWTLSPSRYTKDPASNAVNRAAKTFVVSAGNAVGQWVGDTDTNWFNCANWEGLTVPGTGTNVSVSNSAANDVVIDYNATYSNDYNDVASCNNLTITGRKVQIEANANNKLEVHGNLLIDAPAGALDMDDSNAGTADGQLYLYGNWTNNVGNAAFEEGNGTVHLTGNTPQVISNVAPEGTESFYNVILNNNFNTNTSNDIIALGNLTVNAAKTLTVSPNDYVQVNNDLTNNGTFDILNNGSLIQVNDVGVNTGNIFMKRMATIRLLDYVYWSSPVAGFAVTTISPTTSLSKIWKWNTSAVNPNGGFGNWQNANEIMSIGKGYIVRGPNGFNATPRAFTANFVGIPNNGIKNVTIERGNFTGADYLGTNGASITKNDDNWNLIGNPYPSAISAVDFLALNANIEGSVRVWTHGTLPSNAATSPFYNTYSYNYSASDYIVYNATGPSTQNGFDGYIGAGQSFFVLMNDGPATTETVTFQNALRNKGQRNDQFFRNANLQNTTNSIERHRIWIDLVSATGNVNRALVGYVEGATQNKDRLYDAYSDRKNAQDFYSVVNNEPLVIQGRALPFSADDLVPMGVKLPTNGTYTIALATVDGLFSNNAQTIYLEDKVLNVIHNLSNAPYQFTANQGVVNNRFVLRYTNATLSNHDFETAENNVAISTVNNDIKVSSSLENIKELSVYNVLGQVLATKKNVNANQAVVSSIVRSQQALIVKVTLENGQTSTRKIIF